MDAGARREHVALGERCRVRFMRTLRLPEDGREYPLPPGFGTFPVFAVEDYADRVPPAWHERGGVFVPLHQREALWLRFEGAWWRPSALKVGVGGVDAVSGESWDEQLHDDPQDYVVVPEQPWLDGINAGDGFVRQFVALRLGEGYTVEGQLTGREEVGGIQLVAFEPKPGRFPDEPPVITHAAAARAAPAPAAAMGVAAGGRMRQAIYPDPYGLDTWDAQARTSVHVHLVDAVTFQQITGVAPPPTPIDAKAYTAAGLPWFALYDEHKGDVAGSKTLADVKTVSQVDADKRLGAQQDDTSVDVDPGQVVHVSETQD